MKKTLSLLLAVLMITLVFASCKKNENAEVVKALIKECPKTVTLDNADALIAAHDAYESLSDEDKAAVGNYSKLEKLYDKYTELNDFGESVNAILKAAETSFSDEEFAVSGLIEKYDEMVETYGKMKKSEQEMFPDFDKLADAVEKLKGYTDTALDAAAAYVKAFTQTYPDCKITELGCIKQIREEKEYHFFALKYTDKAKIEHAAYSTARYVGAEAYPTILAHPELFFAEKPASESSDALANGNTVLDIDAALAAAENIETVSVTAAATEPAETAEAAE